MTMRTRILFVVILLLAAGVVFTAATLGWSSRRAMLGELEAAGDMIARLLARSAELGVDVRRDVEEIVGDQMVIEATLAAHFVDVAERAELTPQEINARLRDIIEETVLDEFWITDGAGYAYLRNWVDIDFTFSPDPDQQPQAHEFWPLLTGKRRVVVQQALPRELDQEVFKYVGVAGTDGPRIVQVGYNARFLEELSQRMGLVRLVEELVRGGAVAAIHVVDENLSTLAFSALPETGLHTKPEEQDLERLRTVLREQRLLSTMDGSYLKVMAPMESEGAASGAIVVHLPTDRVRAAIFDEAIMTAVVAAVVLLTGFLVSVFVARAFSAPIVRLTETSRRIADGDLTQKVTVSSIREIGQLGASFNDMTRQLTESIERLKKTTAAKERIESELNIAHEIQMSMVPKVFPPFPTRSEIDLYATLIPAREVGGDFYDFFLAGEDRLYFAIGDVAGKGVPASLFMAVTTTLLKATGGKLRAPDAILKRLNEETCRDNDSCMFVTLFCGVLDLRSGKLVYCNGGHNFPFVVSNGVARPLDNSEGIAIGVTEMASYRAKSIVLRPCDRLFLYTDGVTEATDLENRLFSAARLQRVLEESDGDSSEQLVQRIVGAVRKFSCGAPQADDITALGIRYLGDRGGAT